MLFPEPIPLKTLSKNIPEWRWPSYPRIATTPSLGIARKLRSYLNKQSNYGRMLPDIDQPMFAATEGAKRFRIHLARERNRAIVEVKKKKVLGETGKLECEVCTFDFEGFYGEQGREFCEVHHLKPLSQVDEETETTLEDLAVVCSNCHRMLHRSGSLKSIPVLRQMIAIKQNAT